MDKNEDDMQLSIYKPLTFTGGCLEIRLFYVRIVPCAVDHLPDHLTLRHLRRELGVFLEINGARIPSSDAVSIALRRDRVDKDSSEVTYVTTDSIKISGPVEFEVCEEGKDLDLILCGSLQRADAAAAWSNGSVLENDSKTGWSMDCYVANAIATNGRSTFFQPKIGICSPSIEVYVAGCCSGVPVILTKTILVSPRKKVSRQGMLDAIPEDEEMGKEQRSLSNGLLRQRKLPFMEEDRDDYESDGKVIHNYYTEDMYPGEDGQLSWFNAGVRVGVGIGLGMCLGVGIGVGLLMRSYQATTRSFRRSKILPSCATEETLVWKCSYGILGSYIMSRCVLYTGSWGKMSGTEEVKEQTEVVMEDADKSMPSTQQEEAVIKKKYGGILPKKPPLISKDHERAYFDSADWALGKQGVEKPKGPLEALRPKLQPTQQQTRYRKSPYAPSDGEDGNTPPPEEAATNE
ncbi:UNVERIFIED_CONTAM: hypothetical protein Scaly_0242200 [Sesamum calycinum]|uniref:cAMP-regulated phosphoprotein 19-related protein n=1 Tax=Sesamum calycinum TaxID=2727403 RepID=A0AAW2T1C3_9LAMI